MKGPIDGNREPIHFQSPVNGHPMILKFGDDHPVVVPAESPPEFTSVDVEIAIDDADVMTDVIRTCEAETIGAAWRVLRMHCGVR